MKLSTFALLLAVVAWPLHSWAQETSENKTENRKRAKVIRTWTQQKDGEGQTSGTITLDGKNHKVIIVGPDGKQQELELPGSGSITITQSVERTEKDGEVEEKSAGKAIIRTPDGQEHQIDLGAGGLDLHGAVPRIFKFHARGDQHGQPLPILAEPATQLSKFYIGIVCEPLDDETREKLELGEKEGLVIREVTEESPAQKAGLQANDVVLFANDDETGEVEDVIAVVEKAGQAGDEIALTIIRDGDEKKVMVRPAERPEMPAQLELEGDLGDLQDLKRKFEDLKFDFAFDPEQMRRGIVIPGMAEGFDQASMAKLHEQMAKAHEQLNQAREELSKTQAEMHEEIKKLQKDFHKQMEEAHRQLEKALKDLHSKSQKDD